MAPSMGPFCVSGVARGTMRCMGLGRAQARVRPRGETGTRAARLGRTEVKDTADMLWICRQMSAKEGNGENSVASGRVMTSPGT